MKKPIIIASLLAFLFFLLGIVIEMLTPIAPTVYLIAMIVSLLPLFLLVIGIFTAKHILSRVQKTDIATGQSYLLRHREQAEASSRRLLTVLKRYRTASVFCTVLFTLLAVIAAILGGIAYHHVKLLSAVFLIYAAILFLAVGSRILPIQALTPSDNAPILSPEEFPTIHTLIDKAKGALGVRESVTAILTPDANASIIKNKNRIFLQLGIQLLQLLDEKELYGILLHEFSHVSSHRRAHFAEAGHYERLLSAPYDAPKLSFLSFFFRLFDIPFLVNFMVYRYVNAVFEETEADRAMAKYAEPHAVASALVKLEYETKYRYETSFTDDISIYEDETPRKDVLANYFRQLTAVWNERQSDWDAFIRNEILANNATHPTLKMRLDAIGVTEWQVKLPEHSEGYQKELDAALEKAEARLYAHRSESYQADRKEHYLDPLARIAAWQDAGSPIAVESYADIITDLEALCRFREAETVCERAIDTLPTESAYHAYYTKGLYLLHRYDPNGLSLVYRAVENNHNYLEEGLFEIGTFCCLTGRQEELDEYRRRAPVLAQKNKDENSQAEYLSKTDRLSKETLPDGMLDDILSFILSVDENIIENIYLVRKTISESFFTSVFILHFYGGTDAQREEILHKVFRYLDSYPVDWQFSLFDYFEYPEIKVEKIEGSLVYSKRNAK